MNIAEILKNVPKGTKLYSTVFGNVEFLYVNYELEHPIKVKTCKNTYEFFDEEGKYNIYYSEGECVLFPSRKNRDWNTFQIEKSYEFKPYDKVLVRIKGGTWKCDYFSYMIDDYYVCIGNMWRECIPYNDDTKHLIGTNKGFKN